ncbi:uncharacterized protein LOC142574891 [Dermacentor variabilis]|uniref:uncharacterized protein LOC142574891 n=1 Tax=Dermacentor variabilis TaxID=34621 RepID=UPI003F5C7231
MCPQALSSRSASSKQSGELSRTRPAGTPSFPPSKTLATPRVNRDATASIRCDDFAPGYKDDWPRISSCCSTRRRLRRRSGVSNCVRRRRPSISPLSWVDETRQGSRGLSFWRLPRVGNPLVQRCLPERLGQRNSRQRKAPPASQSKTLWSRIGWCNLGVASRSSFTNQDDGSQEAERAGSWYSVSSQEAPAPRPEKLRPPPDHRRSTAQSWPQFQRWCLAQGRRVSLRVHQQLLRGWLRACSRGARRRRLRRAALYHGEHDETFNTRAGSSSSARLSTSPLLGLWRSNFHRDSRISQAVQGRPGSSFGRHRLP